MLTNGLISSQTYLKRVREYDTEAKYICLGWNYMPPSGSSQLHPHLQIEATYSPTPYHKDLLEASLRTDVCITVPLDTQVDGEIGLATIPAGKYVITHFEIMPDQYGDAWNAVYGDWLPES
jgi:hypothetical protein